MNFIQLSIFVSLDKHVQKFYALINQELDEFDKYYVGLKDQNLKKLQIMLGLKKCLKVCLKKQMMRIDCIFNGHQSLNEYQLKIYNYQNVQQMSLERQEEENQLLENEKLSDQQDKIILTLFSISMNAILGILFFYYSTNDSKHGGDQCKYLRPVALTFAIYCFLSLFASIILNPFAIYYEKDTIFDYVNIAEGSLRLLFFIIFIIAFIISSNCGHLTILTAIYIILNVAIFITLCIMTHFIKPKLED